MRKLLLFFAFVLTSIGVKAYTLDLTKTWPVDGANEKVAKISLDNAGELTTALADLNGQMTDYSHLYISNGAGFDLTTEDLAALGTVTCPTLDLQNLYGAGGGHHAPFTFSNASIKRVILPDYWDKAAVKAAAEAIVAVNNGFEAALSQHGQQNQSTADAKLVAYVQKPGTLYTAMRHTYFDGRADKKMGNATKDYCAFDKLGYVSIMGYPSALDFNGNDNTAGVKFDPNGHFVFDREADETSVSANAGIGGTRALTGTAHNGAITGAALIQLDLGDAVIYEEWCNDITLSWSYVIGDRTKEIIFPTCSELKTIPADCLNTSLPLLEEICIPGNIENLKTRSFWISNQVLRHVWTTGTTEHMRYDNGAYLHDDHDNPDHYGHAPLNDPIWNAGQGKGENGQGTPRYGTITLPENLKLIESHCFTARSVSDVYVLAKVAPECHVDAFSSIMYMGNNTIDTQYTNNQGMITRWSYAQGDAVAEYITFLHYPRECGTPEIQRYTDPTREYSVATTWRDGKGNVVYFPNQSEFNRAYIQGTTGYLWYAWDSERVPEPAGNANSFKNANPSTSGGHTTDLQQTANDLYIANTMEDPDKTDRSFYDVRLDPTGQPTLTKPADLKWYYNTIWEDKQLYPKPETVGVVDEQGNPVMETVPVYDANGNIIYDPAAAGATYEGNYIRNEVDVYVKASDGAYYHPLLARNNDGNKPKPWYSKTQKQVADPDGDYIWTNTIGNQYNYTECSTWLTWGHTEAELAEKRATGWTFSMQDVWVKDEHNGTHYISDEYVTYSEGATDYVEGVNATRYNKVIDYEFTEATSSDAGPFWTMRTEIAQAQEVTKKRDYRGWHQFVLHAYDTNDERPLTPVKFYQSDPDWWTVCLPYDLKYSEMVRFFGNGEGKIPYLSKLRYVVRDYDKEKITLMFSKNLMVYKEAIPEATTEMIDPVHGIIDDKTKWIGDGEGQYADLTALKAADPIILHKGVPYLIKPNIPEGANRSFDVFKTETPDLYNRLIDSQNVPAAQLETYIYKGEYTVPAYVIGDTDKEETVASRTFTHTEVGPSFTYNSSDKIMYGGKEVEAKISKDFSYTFVGSFFLSVLPQYCYFLGWDSKNSRAAFWYNRVPNLASQDWNNQTGIICPNFNTSKTIDPATSLSDPARWILAASDVKNDDLVGVASGAKKSLMDMDFGSIDVVVSGIGKINVDNTQNNVVNNDVIYDMRGVRMNRPLSRLTKGVYIVNGKKYVVD